MHQLIQSVIVVVLSAASADTAESDGQKGVDCAVFEVSRLQCIIGNNAALEEHAAWYNGIFRMTSPDRDETPFVPRYAGFNLEHYFDVRPPNPDRTIFFEPGKHIRITHSPSGGGRTKSSDDTNPAWDFQFLMPDVELEKGYGFRARVVYKSWVDRADVLDKTRSFLDSL